MSKIRGLGKLKLKRGRAYHFRRLTCCVILHQLNAWNDRFESAKWKPNYGRDGWIALYLHRDLLGEWKKVWHLGHEGLDLCKARNLLQQFDHLLPASSARGRMVKRSRDLFFIKAFVGWSRTSGGPNLLVMAIFSNRGPHGRHVAKPNSISKRHWSQGDVRNGCYTKLFCSGPLGKKRCNYNGLREALVLPLLEPDS